MDYQKTAERFLGFAREAAAAGKVTAGRLSTLNFIIGEAKGLVKIDPAVIAELARQGHANSANDHLNVMEVLAAEGKDNSGHVYLAAIEVEEAGGLDAAEIKPERWDAVVGTPYAPVKRSFERFHQSLKLAFR